MRLNKQPAEQCVKGSQGEAEGKQTQLLCVGMRSQCLKPTHALSHKHKRDPRRQRVNFSEEKSGAVAVACRNPLTAIEGLNANAGPASRFRGSSLA
jgi:hypothetical protein